MAAAALALALLAQQIYTRPYPAQQCKLHEAVETAVQYHFAAESPKALYVLKLHNLQSWGVTALLLRELYRQRIPFCVAAEYGFLFGRAFVCRPQQANNAHLVLHAARAKSGQAPESIAQFQIRHERYWFERED